MRFLWPIFGLYSGFYPDVEALKGHKADATIFSPQMSEAMRTEKQKMWEQALSRDMYKIK